MSRLTGSEAQSLMEAYNAVYAPQELTEEQIWEQVENWVNSLLEEGYDLSDYTWEEMYEEYINEQGRGASVGSNPNVSQNPIAKAIRGDGPSPTMTPAQRNQARMRPGTPSAKPQVSNLGSNYKQQELAAAEKARISQIGTSRQGSAGPGAAPGNTLASRQPAPSPKPAAPAPAPRPGTPGAAAKPAPAPAAATTPPKPSTSVGFNAPPAGSPPPSAAYTGPKLGATPPPAAAPAPAAAAPAPAPAPKPSALAQRVAGYKAGGPVMGARERMLNQSLDLFDIVKGHLLDEGYADTEDAALAIMANMSEQWKQSILEG